MTTEPWVTAVDVAQHLGVAKDSVYRWRERKGCPRTGWGGCGNSSFPRSMTGCARAARMKTK